MAAPQIPNLLDKLRTSRANTPTIPPSSRGRGPRLPGRAALTEGQRDTVIQQTDDDAAGSRVSAVDVGYLDDPFARMFLSTASGARGGTVKARTTAPSSPSPDFSGAENSNDAAFLNVRRMPIINRGTYVRTTAIDSLVDDFLRSSSTPSPGKTTKKKQIISLGAGTDTRYFRLVHRDPSLAKVLIYHEIDFPATVAKKISILERHGLSKLLYPSSSKPSSISVSEDRSALLSESYNLHSLDIRQLNDASPPSIPNFDPAAATLILSECCLTYLDASTSTAILKHIAQKQIPDPQSSLSVVLYEPIHPTDAFGRTMLANLAARHIHMPGLEAFPDLQAHFERLREAGFSTAQEGWEVRAWWDDKVSQAEKTRLRILEGLDEEEEWVLLSSHYALIHAWR